MKKYEYSEVMLGQVDKLAAVKDVIYISSCSGIHKIGEEDPIFFPTGDVLHLFADDESLLVVANKVYAVFVDTGRVLVCDAAPAEVCSKIESGNRLISSLARPLRGKLSGDQELAFAAGSAKSAIHVKNGKVDLISMADSAAAGGEVYVYAGENEEEGVLAVGAEASPGRGGFVAAIGGAGGVFFCKERSVVFYKGNSPPRELTPALLPSVERITSACAAGGCFYVGTNFRLLMLEYGLE